MAEEAEEAVYTGIVKKVSAKDPQKYIVECPEASDAYGAQVLLPAAKKPEAAKLGDAISFTVHPTKPLITWAEKVKKDKKRKVEDTVSAEVYTGKVLRRSEKQPSLYIVDCPVVTEWYGTEARLPEKLWPEGLELGGDINFAIKETQNGRPLVAWAEFADRKPPPEERTPKAKKQPAFTPGWSAEIDMKDVESAIEAWALDGQEFRGVALSVVHHPKTEDGLKFKVTGVPVGTMFNELKQHFRKVGEVGFCRIHSPYAVGELRFHDSDTAESALALYGSVCKGAQLRVELDSRCEDGTKVRVMGLPPGFKSSALMQHFREVGEIAGCTVRDITPG
mmetsp:Transcript_5939/g.17771  ORF Transcript_5939/g.17771 Transcript_5939/m.17771 type:complete len:335 (-) Transcript_5939:50-1054(-)